MKKQLIVSISREFGSGGRDIAEIIAKDLGLPMYDRNLLREIAKDMNMDVEELKSYDEMPRNYILTRRVGRHSNSMEDILAEKQIEFLQKKAGEGESFVVVGRCSETILKEFDGLITIFVMGETEYKKGRIMGHYQLNEAEALDKMAKIDRKRKQFHGRYSDHKWGDARYYDLCINGSHLGVEGTAQILKDYIRARVDKRA